MINDPLRAARLLCANLDMIAASEPDFLVEDAIGEIENLLGGPGITGFADAIGWKLDDIRQRMLDDAGKREVGEDGLLQYRIDCDQYYFAEQFVERARAILAPLQTRREAA